jgi:hypothetical protein
LLNLKDRERGFCLVMLKDVSRDVLFAFILIGIPGNRENDCVCVCVCERERERERIGIPRIRNDSVCVRERGREEL